MLIIRNNIIPFPGYKCINICGILFARKKAEIDETTINHESIHSKQIFEMLIIFFYLWYVIEWIVRCFQTKDMHSAYRKVSFEQEAYTFEKNKGYLSWRPWYYWTRFF